MDQTDEYLDDARRLTDAAFRDIYGDLFLLKAPTETTGADWDEGIQYQTQAVAPGEDDGDDLSLDPEFRHTWRVTPIRKRPGSPFPSRISVGRAKNCDVVLRLSYVSKLHAHFFRSPDGSLMLIDQDSANGTKVNAKTLTDGVAVTVGAGDEITFGRLTCELVEAPALRARILEIAAND